MSLTRRAFLTAAAGAASFRSAKAFTLPRAGDLVPVRRSAKASAERTGDVVVKNGRLKQSVSRWPSGIYMVWYPLKAGASADEFKARVRDSGLRKVLVAELTLWPSDSPFRLNGCGMLIANPPWRLDIELAPLRQNHDRHRRELLRN